MHKTAVLLLPIAALTATQNRIWTFIWLGVISLGAYYIFLVEMVEVLFKNYVEAQSQSSGSSSKNCYEHYPWNNISSFPQSFSFSSKRKIFMDLVFFVSNWFGVLLISVSTASTAIDRLALYILPLQLVIFSNLPDIFSSRFRRLLVFSVISYCSLILFVWLNFASHAYLWLLYKNFFISLIKNL